MTPRTAAVFCLVSTGLLAPVVNGQGCDPPVQCLDASLTGAAGVGNVILSCDASSCWRSVAGGLTRICDQICPTVVQADGGCVDEGFSGRLAFSWYSVADLPGGEGFFPKIFAGGLPQAEVGMCNMSANSWETTTTVETVPGIVSLQQVCTDAVPPIYGPINYFNATTFSADLSLAGPSEPIEDLSMQASFTLGAYEVIVRSTVSPDGNVFRYDYDFENGSSAPITIDWGPANLERTLKPYEIVTVTLYSAQSAHEAQGYAHLLDGAEALADMVAMALVPQTLLGDLSADGVVDVDDLIMLIGSWGACAGPCAADLDGDGQVAVSDMVILFANWG